MKNYIFILSIFISSSAFLFAQTEDVEVSPEPIYVSSTDREASAKARILARQKLKETQYKNPIEKKENVCALHKRARKIAKQYSTPPHIAIRTATTGVYGQGRIYNYQYIETRDLNSAAYLRAYNDEIRWIKDSLWMEYLYKTTEDLDETIDVLKKRNIEPGHISYFYSNQVMIINEKEIEHYLKNITANNNHSKPLEKYTKNNVSRIFLVVYQWDKGSHVKAFLFTPKGVVFERLYFTNVRNAVNPKTGTTIYVTEEEALIFTEG